jgi:hypothetical protein
MVRIAKGFTAVMGRRREPPAALDYFPTPPWATRALFRHVLPALGIDAIASVWEPACGEGHMAAVITELARGPVVASDIYSYGYGTAPVDFLHDAPITSPKWIITNPPFSTACEFTLRALDLAGEGVAMLVRTQWIEGVGRYEKLFRDRPPVLYAPFVERVPMARGDGTPMPLPPPATLGLCGARILRACRVSTGFRQVAAARSRKTMTGSALRVGA